MYSTRMRMTGSSGMDIDSIVTDLMKAESQRLYKTKRESILLSWRQEAYRNTAKTLTNFQSTYLDTIGAKKMHMTSSYQNFVSKVRASGTASANAASVSTSYTASEGEYKVKILKLAEKASIQGAQNEIKASDSAGFVDGILKDGGTTEFSVRYDGALKTIDLAKKSDGTVDAEFAALKASHATNPPDPDIAGKLEAHINARLKEAFGTEYTNEATVEDIATGSDKNTRAKVSISITADGVSFADSNKRIIVNGLGKAGIEENSSNVTDSITTLASLDIEDEQEISINGKKIAIYGEMTIETLMSKINDADAGVKVTFDKAKQSYQIETTDTGQLAQINFDDDETAKLMKDAFGFDKSVAKAFKAGSDSVIQVNGTTVHSASNSVTIDTGVVLNLHETTVDESTKTASELTITVSKDNDKLLNDIKDFINSYNEMIESLQTDLKTARPKSDKYSYYEPLLDEEKEGLSDKEIEKMEEKAKTGLLRNDSILSSIVSGMRAAMNASIDLGDGKKISLFDIGISTSSDTTKGAKLEIDEDKLKKAIAERGDDITVLFAGSGVGDSKVKGVANLLADEIVKATNTKNGTITKRAGIENKISATDNTLYKMIQDKNDRIESMIDALRKKEDAYYRKFNAMEKAMNASQNQVSSLMSQLGM